MYICVMCVLYYFCRPNAFAVITPSRVFNLVAENSAEMHMWIGGIIIHIVHIHTSASIHTCTM